MLQSGCASRRFSPSPKGSSSTGHSRTGTPPPARTPKAKADTLSSPRNEAKLEALPGSDVQAQAEPGSDPGDPGGTRETPAGPDVTQETRAGPEVTPAGPGSDPGDPGGTLAEKRCLDGRPRDGLGFSAQLFPKGERGGRPLRQRRQTQNPARARLVRGHSRAPPGTEPRPGRY